MTLSRKALLRFAAGAVALPLANWKLGVRSALALDYPTRPVRIIVGFPAGTSSDISARLVAQRLSEQLGQQFVVENRTGAGTNVAADSVVHASPDGYTLLWVTQTNAINATLYDALNFKDDIRPAGSILRVPAVMMVNPSVPAKTVPEFIAYAKANPGKINMSSPGIGSINHVAGELFNMMAGVELTHIPYRSSQFPDLLSGQVQVTFNPLPSSLDFIRAGKLRGLAVTSATHSDALPELPAVGDFLPGYEATEWFGIGAPRNTPSAVVDEINKQINAALADPQLRGRLIDLGGTPMPMSVADLRILLPPKPGSGPRSSSSPAPNRSDKPEGSEAFGLAKHGFADPPLRKSRAQSPRSRGCFRGRQKQRETGRARPRHAREPATGSLAQCRKDIRDRRRQRQCGRFEIIGFACEPIEQMLGVRHLVHGDGRRRLAAISLPAGKN